jgi:hypothetical protein
MLFLALTLIIFALAVAGNGTQQFDCLDLIFLNQSSIRDTMDLQQSEQLKQCVRDAPPIAELK